MIDVKNLTKMYGTRIAIEDISFTVAKGEILGFLGPNGAGKSTTMKILTGFMPATSGTASVCGFDVFNSPMEIKKVIGYLPENPPVYLEMPVDEYITFVAKLHDVPKNQLKTRVDYAIEKTALGDVRKRIIGNLSKGFRQRVGLAQAVVHDPKVLILDEPTVGLDPVQIVEIRELIKSLAGEHTIVLSTHILPEVTATCQKILIINRGKIVAQDLIANLGTSGNYFMTVKKIENAGIEAISKVAGVEKVSGTGHQISITLSPGCPDNRDIIIETAIKSGLKVLEFGSKSENLEQVFLKYTSQDYRQQGDHL